MSRFAANPKWLIYLPPTMSPWARVSSNHYGPEYTEEHNLRRLRERALGAKRSLALREFALGIEGLERFVRLEPLRRVHECAFGVLA